MIKGVPSTRLSTRLDDGHLGSEADRGTHIGYPLKAEGAYWLVLDAKDIIVYCKLTNDAWVFVISCVGRVQIVASRVDCIRVVDSDNLATLESNLAISTKSIDDTIVGSSLELRD